MSRTSSDQYVNGKLENGYDYTRQAWVVNGKYVSCGHPKTMDCGCFGRIHAGEASLEFRPDLNLSMNDSQALELLTSPFVELKAWEAEGS